MAALQARAFAQAGFSVLQLDLYGCGDSSGDFGDARWEIWKRDLALASTWLMQSGEGPLHLWGLRLGANLALECWGDMPDRYASAILWQPVINGQSFLNQFLRLAVAEDALRANGHGRTTDTLRATLSAGQSVEVAGYELAPELASAIASQQLASWSLSGATLHWLDIRASASDMPPMAQQLLESWQRHGVAASYRPVSGEPFWTTQEIVELPQLIAVTTALYAAPAQ